MSPRINSATVIPVGNKVGFLFSLFFVILLMALPAVTQAATPWYSHGKSHTLTLTQDGAVWALGDNSYGQLGIGTYGGNAGEPVMVKGFDGVVALLAGTNHSVALKKDGTVWTWGFNRSGQLGNGTTQHSSAPHNHDGIHFTAENENIITAMLLVTQP